MSLQSSVMMETTESKCHTPVITIMSNTEHIAD